MTRKIAARLSFLALALAGTTALTPAEGRAGTLVEELNALLQNHPQIEGARENVSAADEGVNRAFGDFLPDVKAIGSFGYENIDSPGRRATAQGKEYSVGNAAQTTLTVTQTVFSGFRFEATHDSAKAQKSVAEAQLEGGTQATMLEGISAYLEVLRNIRLVKLVLDAENEVFDARINLVAAQHDARLATYRLLTAMGRLTIPNIASGADGAGGKVEEKTDKN